MKEFLSRERCTFTVRNVEDDESAYDELTSMGFRVVPVTVVNGRAIKGFDEPALRAALAASAP
ncbi:MAG: glutaredoxin family protein [Vicinamibacterales bacterium]